MGRARGGQVSAGRQIILAAILVLACWLAVSPLSAQGSPEDDEIFFDTVDVNVVNVEVFVTDRKGNPITGLTREDFELLEDGEPVEVTNFLAIQGGGLAATEDPELTPTEGAAGPPRLTTIPRDQRLHVVIFLDNLNIDARNRNPVITHLRRFLRESLGPQDRVMLTSFDGSLKIEQEFTSLPERLFPKLETMATSSTGGFEIEARTRSLFQAIQRADTSDTGTALSVARAEAEQIYGSIQTHAQQIKDRTRLTLETLQQLTDSLAGLPGRKALLYVSGGLPLRPGEALLEAWDNKFGSLGQNLGLNSSSLNGLEYDTSTFFREMVAKASSNRVVIYTIDAVQHRSYAGVSAEQGGFDLGLLGQADGGRTLTPELNARIDAGFRDSMQYLADGSGGLSFINTRALGKNLFYLANDFKTYYSLGYSPNRKADGKFRSLKVRVPEGRYRIRHRSGFRDKTERQEMGERTMSALLLNVSENPLGISIERGPDESAGRRKFHVPLLVKVPLDKIALLPNQESHRGKVSVFVAVANEDGGSSKVEERKLPVEIPSDRVNQALGQYIGHELKLEMRGGFHRLAVGVRDDVAGVTSTVRFNVRGGS